MLILKWIVCLSLAFGACGVRADVDLENSHYTTGPPNRDGIGKIYMGREISHVMGHLGAGVPAQGAPTSQRLSDP